MSRLVTAGFESGDLLLDGWTALEVNNGTGTTPNNGANFPPPVSASANEHRTLDGTNGGKYGCKLNTNAGNLVITLTNVIPGSPTDIYFRVCFRKNQSSDTGSDFVYFTDQASAVMFYIKLGTTSTDRLTITDNLGAAIVTSSAGHTIPDSATVFTRIEIHATISAGKANIVEVRVDDTPWGELTASAVGPGGSTSFGGFRLHGGNNNQGGGNVSTIIYDDIAVNSATGVTNNGYCGNGFIQGLTPNGVGTFTQLTNSAGNQTNNYTYVNTLPVSGNGTNAVGTSTASQKDTYAIADLPAPALGVNVIQIATYAAKNGPGVTNVNLVGIFNGTESDGSPVALPVGSPNWLKRQLEVNPNTSLPFTRNDVQSMEAGVLFS